jgi:uncharacterized protein with von Willebrand factor type A (vWA) domain
LEEDVGKIKGEYIFLLDRSGSMDGQRILKAKEALTLFIKRLPKDAYFNIISFGSDSYWMFKMREKYNNQSAEKAIEAVSKMNADMGGTQIFNPLSKLL